MTQTEAPASPCTDRVRNALTIAAAEVGDYLRSKYAPPVWIHVVDILHKHAGNVWDETAEADGGCYVCPGCGFSVEHGPCDAALIAVGVKP